MIRGRCRHGLPSERHKTPSRRGPTSCQPRVFVGLGFRSRFKSSRPDFFQKRALRRERRRAFSWWGRELWFEDQVQTYRFVTLFSGRNGMDRTSLLATPCLVQIPSPVRAAVQRATELQVRDSILTSRAYPSRGLRRRKARADNASITTSPCRGEQRMTEARILGVTGPSVRIESWSASPRAALNSC